ncbi:MAG TPA: GH92 family glycosyl hydrolase [Verrucomicrobiae bacterium]
MTLKTESPKTACCRKTVLGEFIALAVLLAVSFAAQISRAEMSPVDYCNPLIGTAEPRWDYLAPACRPFGMVSLSPDTRVGGDWMCGYNYNDTNILCFSHIHCWELYGLPVMPITGKFNAPDGLAAAASGFSHKDEVVHPGYYKVFLQRYGITAELTSTMRVGFQRYTFPASDSSFIAFDTGATLMAQIDSSAVRQVGPQEIAGYSVMAPSEMNRRPKPFTVYFVARFSKPVKFGAWSKKQLVPDANSISGKDVGAYASFSTTNGEQVLLKVAISYTSEENARKNLAAELPGWDFDGVVRESKDDWNRWLGRIEVQGGTEAERVKFYTDLWHDLLGRHVVSDADGSYCDMTSGKPVVRRVTLDAQGHPRFPQYNFDALWGGQWSFNLLWSFAYPEVMDGFCNTLVNMYRDGGFIDRGVAGGNYTFVMIGDPATSFFAAAYNKGIRNFDVNLAYEGLRKNALPRGARDHAGYEWGTNASGGGMKYYIERGYVPQNIGGRGMHKDGGSMTLEYAYEDWCLGQFAQALGKTADAAWLTQRSFNYTNLWDSTVSYMRPRNKDGSWLEGFAPVGKMDAFNTGGFTESDSAIYTYFVPQDVPGLIHLFGGREKFINALNRQFELAASDHFSVGYVKGRGHGGMWVDYGNEPSTAMAHLFNLAGAPWLSQKWVRAVKEQTYGGVTPTNGYTGDDDQGDLSAVSALMAIGLFDVEGGAEVNPAYQITSPVFDRITIHLNPDYFPGRKFTIITHNNSPQNIYIQSAKLNGQPLDRYWFSHADLVKGGTLELELGPAPDKAWGLDGATTAPGLQPDPAGAP